MSLAPWSKGCQVRFKRPKTGGSLVAPNLFITRPVEPVNLTGALNVSGTINANELNINVINKNVINLDASGSTKFGDSTDDTHVFTGSAFFSSSTNPLQLRGLRATSASSSYHYLALDSNYNVILTAYQMEVTW